MAARLDPVTTQVVRFALERVADEMGHTVTRTARSTQIKEIKDVSCAVFDRYGRTVAQAHHAPMLLTGFDIAMGHILRKFRPEDLQPGDVIACNDPFLGGQHVMDLLLFAPIHCAGELVGWVACMAHQTDLGGAAPGGVAGGMTEIFQEGLRLPLVKLYVRGNENRDLFQVIEGNVRVPDQTMGDIRAQGAATLAGVQRAARVFTRYGRETVESALQVLMDYAEERMRAALRRLPDGRWTGVDHVDNDGLSPDPVRIQVNVEKRGDEIWVDFDGTAIQTRGNINCPLAATTAAVYYGLIGVADPHLPPNAGAYRPIRLVVSPGLVVNPLPPAAVAARSATSMKVVDALMFALAQAAPERVTAGHHAQITNCSFSGLRPGTNKPFVYIDISHGGMGARAGKDGRDGQDSHLARFMNTPTEAIELEYPVRLERVELICDSGGPGRYRGALGFRRDIRLLTDATWARYGDRQAFRPRGVFGGGDGAPGRFILNPDTPREQPAQAKGLTRLQAGDLVSLRMPGGGGYGRPWERDPAAVLEDVLDGKVSVAAAREQYGVILTPDGRAVDAVATAALRAAAGGGA